MKIRFDYGKEPVPAYAINTAMNAVSAIMSENFGLHLGSVNIYLSFYDENNEIKDFASDDHIGFDLIVRPHPYKVQNGEKIEAFENKKTGIVGYWVKTKDPNRKYE